jgi:hypothetical protein
MEEDPWAERLRGRDSRGLERAFRASGCGWADELYGQLQAKVWLLYAAGRRDCGAFDQSLFRIWGLLVGRR